MLRVKEGVDLKEFERFGFRPVYSETTGKIVEMIYPNVYFETNGSVLGFKKVKTIRGSKFSIKNFSTPMNKIYLISLLIDPKNMTTNLFTLSDGRLTFYQDVLYDIIKADLVEKWKERKPKERPGK